MKRAANVLVVVAVLAGLIIHIGLGYRFGLVITGVAVAAHLLAGVVARRLWRRRTPT
ncbi:hypothetical protein ACWGE0_11775 [Lentzea sp. NPDC054927]